jgi:GntR family transcriptional regulator, transcriptional repressor for pyruvate dehydrogenase complex
MDDWLISLHAAVARDACARMTQPGLKALQDSVEQAACLSARFQWDRKATAHAEIFNLLADISGDAALSRNATGTTAHMYHLVVTVGPAADGIILSSRRRLLEKMRAGDADGAASEMEDHLRGLAFMWRLARRSPRNAVAV